MNERTVRSPNRSMDGRLVDAFNDGYFSRYYLKNNLSHLTDIEFDRWLIGWKQSESDMERGFVEFKRKLADFFCKEYGKPLYEQIETMPDRPDVVVVIWIQNNDYSDNILLEEFIQYSNFKLTTIPMAFYDKIKFRLHMFGFSKDSAKTLEEFETRLKSVIIRKNGMDYFRFENGIATYYFSKV